MAGTGTAPAAMTSIHWNEQARLDRLKKVVVDASPPFNPDRVALWSAGYNTGWMDCIATLRLHGIIN